MKQPLLPFSDAIAARQAAEDVRITRAMGRPWKAHVRAHDKAHVKREATRAGRDKAVRFREVAA